MERTDIPHRGYDPNALATISSRVRAALPLIGVTAVLAISGESLAAPDTASADCVTTQTADGVNHTSCQSSSSENCAITTQNGVTTNNCEPATAPKPPEAPSTAPPHSTDQPKPQPHEPHKPAHHPKPKPHHQPSNSTQRGTLDYYKDPLRDIHHLIGRRIDMGVDYSGYGNVHALGKGVVTVVKKGTSAFWRGEGGNVVVYRLTEGPAKGSNVFVSENCTPTVYRGEKVTTNTTVCYMHDHRPNIEMGWAQGGGSDKPAAWRVYTPAGNPDGSKTAYGVNFSRLMGLLGAPRGNTTPGHVSTNPNRTVGRIPRDFPRWLS
jgi:hypothetical protein